MNTLKYCIKFLSGFAGIGLLTMLMLPSIKTDMDEEITDWDKMECDWDI